MSATAVTNDKTLTRWTMRRWCSIVAQLSCVGVFVQTILIMFAVVLGKGFDWQAVALAGLDALLAIACQLVASSPVAE